MKVTVFTPTYNRAYILENLYRSLQRQSSFDFEWLIVDDGSIDNTRNLIENWIKEDNKFTIVYHYKENGGKCRAINYALDYARGELFFTVDSDDYLTDDAIKKIIEWENGIPNVKKICGFSANIMTKNGIIPNPIFEECYVDCDMGDRYPRKENNFFFIGHDRAWIFYLNIHRKYYYPEYDGEKFMPEAVVWNRMANDGYKIRCFNDAIYVYEQHQDGLTSSINNIFLSNPKGYCLWKKEMNEFFYSSFFIKMKNIYSIYCDLNKKYNEREICDYLETSIFYLKLMKIIQYLKKKRR